MTEVIEIVRAGQPNAGVGLTSRRRGLSRGVVPMTEKLPDYFAPAPTEEETVLRRAKGNTRRALIKSHLEHQSLEAVPAPWRSHDLEARFKALLGAEVPHARGGEDLPDLLPGEVEVARMSLVGSVHGEVVSLRARRTEKGNVALRLVDEYGTEYVLTHDVVERAQSADEVVRLFQTAVPCPLDVDCEISFASFFYADLDDNAGRLGIQRTE